MAGYTTQTPRKKAAGARNASEIACLRREEGGGGTSVTGGAAVIAELPVLDTSRYL